MYITIVHSNSHYWQIASLYYDMYFIEPLTAMDNRCATIRIQLTGYLTSTLQHGRLSR